MNSDDSSSNLIKLRPAGSRNGTVWDHKGLNKIVRIFISHGSRINSIQFQYANDVAVSLSDRMGSDNGNNFTVVTLNYPNEYITSIIGHNNLNSGSILCRIQFGTNLGREYGPFGGFCSDELEFHFRLGDDLQFGGFHGTADSSGLNSIGVYVKSTPTLQTSTDKSVVKSIFWQKKRINF